MSLIFEEEITCEVHPYNHVHKVWLHSGGGVYAHEGLSLDSVYGTEDGSEVGPFRYFRDTIVGVFANSYSAKSKRAVDNCHRMMRKRDKLIASTPKG